MGYNPPNIPREALDILENHTGTILDVGGGIAPYHRATHVMDRRAFDGAAMRANAWGGPAHDWSDANYIRHDMTLGPWPIADKAFDLALCSMTLEDIHDPFTPVREMARVAAHTLIVVPTRLLEHVQGVEHPRTCGYGHHMWMVTPQGNTLIFRRKTSALLVPGCHFVCPLGKQLDPSLESTYAYAPSFESQHVGYWDSFQDIDEYRKFVSTQTPRWVDGEAMTLRTLRTRLWAVKARYWK